MPLAARTAVRTALRRLRDRGLVLLHAAVAAGLAWLLAGEVLGHDQPFFAPIAAIITTGVTFGQRTRRAAELVLGVALGILVADLLALGLGDGALQLAVIVGIAMAVAVLFGGGSLLVTQAGVSAVLVVTLQPPETGLAPLRAVDALVGGGVALAVTALLPRNPLALVREAAAPVITGLAANLEDIAAALESENRDAASAALWRARDLDALVARLREAVDVGHETATISPARRRTRAPLAPYGRAAAQLELAVRNTRVLARGAIRALDTGDRVPPDVAAAVRDLAEAVRRLGAWLEDRSAAPDAGEAAVRAAGRATAVLDMTTNLSVSVLVGQVRATAVDLLRGMGVEREDARRAVRQAPAPG